MPNRRLRLLLAPTVLASTVPALAAAPMALGAQTGAHAAAPNAAVTAIDRAARAFRAARTIHATFEQTLTNPNTGNTSTSTGQLSLAQPEKFALQYDNGPGDRVVIDGKWAWVYLPSAAPGQVMKLPAGARGALGVESLGELLTAPRSKYAVADAGAATVGGRATHTVVLTPKQEGGSLARARVWVDDADGAVRQLELSDANGLVRTLRMTAWTTNAKLPASTFTFTVPAGVRVIDRATAAF